MKICLMSPLFDPWNAGGTEKYVNTLADALSQDYKVVVVTTTGPQPRQSTQINSNLRLIELLQNNVKSLFSITTDNPPINPGMRYLWHIIDLFSFKSYSQMIKILENEKPDIVHTNGIRGFSSFLFRAIHSMGIPHVHTLHDAGLMYPWQNTPRDIKNYRPNLIERIFIRYMRRTSSTITSVISPSQYLMDSYSNFGYFGFSKKHVVPHGISLEINARPKDGIGKEFMLLGRVIKSKGPHIAVQAFKKIKEQKARLHIVGDGPYLNEVKNIAKGDNRIIFHGYVPYEDLRPIFEKCSYGLFPTLSPEAFGLVIIELMNHGLPVIASNIGAVSEIVKDGKNGFLFRPGDLDSLCTLIQKAINEEDTLNRLSTDAISSSKNYSIEKELENVKQIYHSLL